MENCRCFHCYLANLTQRPDLMKLLHELYLSEQASGGRYTVKTKLDVTLETPPVDGDDVLEVKESLEDGSFLEKLIPN